MVGTGKALLVVGTLGNAEYSCWVYDYPDAQSALTGLRAFRAYLKEQLAEANRDGLLPPDEYEFPQGMIDLNDFDFAQVYVPFDKPVVLPKGWSS